MTTATTPKDKRYIEAIGRRKTSTARVRATTSTKTSFIINDKEVEIYFPTSELRKIISDPITKNKSEIKLAVTVKVLGGGTHSQAEAIRHGLSRVLVKMDEENKGTLKKLGFLKRDPRQVERKKFGLKKARKSPQWSKR